MTSESKGRIPVNQYNSVTTVPDLIISSCTQAQEFFRDRPMSSPSSTYSNPLRSQRALYTHMAHTHESFSRFLSISLTIPWSRRNVAPTATVELGRARIHIFPAPPSSHLFRRTISTSVKPCSRQRQSRQYQLKYYDRPPIRLSTWLNGASFQWPLMNFNLNSRLTLWTSSCGFSW